MKVAAIFGGERAKIPTFASRDYSILDWNGPDVGIHEAEQLTASVASSPLFISRALGSPVPLDLRVGPRCRPGSLSLLGDAAGSRRAGSDRASPAQDRSFATFHSDFPACAIRRSRLRQDLERAGREQQFELYYQPQLNLVSVQIVGAETLMRWHHPEHGCYL